MKNFARRALIILSAVVVIFAVVIIIDRHTVYDIQPPPKDPDWNAGTLAHMLPTVSHQRILLKASFEEPFVQAPRLVIGEKHFAGHKTDTKGFFWHFDAQGLNPDTTYQLIIQDASGTDL